MMTAASMGKTRDSRYSHSYNVINHSRFPWNSFKSSDLMAH